MSILRSAARNVSIVGASQLIIWPATLVFTIAQARYLGPVRFGELSLALSYAAFLAIAVDFGLGRQLSRMVAQRAHQENALFATVVIRAALWLIAVPFVWLATVAFGYEPELRDTILILAVSVLLLIGVGNTVSEYLQGKEEFLLPSLSSSAQRLTVAGVGLAVLLVRPELIAVAIVFVVGAAVNIAVLLFGLRKRGWVRPQADVAVSFRLFRSAIPLGLYWILAIFYFNVDMVLLERLAPAENVGWYAAAYRLFNMAAIVPMIVVGIVLYPVLARLSLGARGELRIVIEKALTFLTVAGVAAALVLMLFAEPIVALLYPSEAYRAAANALRLLAPGVLFQYLNWVLVCALLGLHREKRMLVIAAGAAILNLIANLVAIPLFREDGAALTTSLTELALLGCLLWSMPKDLLSLENVRVATKAGFAAALAALLVRAVGEQPLVLALPLALLVYGGAALALRVVPPGDLRTLLELRRAPTPSAATAPVPIREEVA